MQTEFGIPTNHTGWVPPSSVLKISDHETEHLTITIESYKDSDDGGDYYFEAPTNKDSYLLHTESRQASSVNERESAPTVRSKHLEEDESEIQGDGGNHKERKRAPPNTSNVRCTTCRPCRILHALCLACKTLMIAINDRID